MLMVKYKPRENIMRYKKIVSYCVGLSILCLASAGIANAQVLPAPAAPGGTLEQRLAQRKQERKIQLIEKDQKRIVSQCRGAQEASRKVQRDTTTIVDKRKAAYNTIDGKLWIINGQLKLSGKDTFNLEKVRSELTAKVATLTATAASYQQSLDDLVLMNCQADPVGFKAILDTARLYYFQLQAQSADIRGHIINAVKPTLDDYATQLQPKSNPEGSN